MLTCHHSLRFSSSPSSAFPIAIQSLGGRERHLHTSSETERGFTKGQNKGLPRSVIRKASRFNNRRVYSPQKAKLVSRSRLISILKTGLGELVGEKVKIF